MGAGPACRGCPAATDDLVVGAVPLRGAVTRRHCSYCVMGTQLSWVTAVPPSFGAHQAPPAYPLALLVPDDRTERRQAKQPPELRKVLHPPTWPYSLNRPDLPPQLVRDVGYTDGAASWYRLAANCAPRPPALLNVNKPCWRIASRENGPGPLPGSPALLIPLAKSGGRLLRLHECDEGGLTRLGQWHDIEPRYDADEVDRRRQDVLQMHLGSTDVFGVDLGNVS